MGARFGLGPVFSYEWITQSRRWQVYAVRSLFGLVLLAAMAAVWSGTVDLRSSPTLQAYAKVGERLFVGLVGTSLALVLLAAPAATAGAVCLDKQRGSLAHLLVTDLSAAEIVLGKLGARLVPVLGLLGGAFPIVALATLLGGIDPSALLGAFLVALGLAVLGCSLALTISVWAAKTHEVLLATYTVFALWLLAVPIAIGLGFRGRRGWASGPDLLEAIDPFRLALRPYLEPGSGNLAAGCVFLGASLAVSAALLSLSVAKIRPVAANPPGPKVRKPKAPAPRRFRPFLPGPSLDGNPVLWREWHRSRPSRITGLVRSVFLGGYGLFAALAILESWSGGPRNEWLAVWTNGFGATSGLLLLSVMASTSLAEERVRGSLDVLLATPLSTREIVWGKWWGAARKALTPAVPLLLIAVALAARSGVWYGPILLLGYYAGLVALIASVGLTAATFLSRPGRAAAATVTFYLVLTVGVFFVVISMTRAGDDSFLGHASPFFAFVIATVGTSRWDTPGSWALRVAVPFWSLCWFATAGGLLLITLRNFDRRMGRVSDGEPRARPAPIPKRRPEPAVVLD